MKFRINAFADEASKEFAEQVDAMKENGVEGLELRSVDGENVTELSFEKAKQIRKTMDDNELVVWAIGSPTGKIGIRDDFGPHLDQFKRTLELANILGAKAYRLFSFRIPQGEEPAACRDEVLLRLNRFCEAALGSGVILCHENEKGIYGDIASRCLDLHRTIPELRAIFDPANFIQCGQDTVAGWELLEPYVEYFHVKDALASGKVVPAGQGVGQLPALIAKFGANGGTQLTLEPHLAVFDALKQIERDGERTEIDPFAYASRREAFTVAVDALKAIIADL